MSKRVTRCSVLEALRKMRDGQEHFSSVNGRETRLIVGIDLDRDEYIPARINARVDHSTQLGPGYAFYKPQVEQTANDGRFKIQTIVDLVRAMQSGRYDGRTGQNIGGSLASYIVKNHGF